MDKLLIGINNVLVNKKLVRQIKNIISDKLFDLKEEYQEKQNLDYYYGDLESGSEDEDEDENEDEDEYEVKGEDLERNIPVEEWRTFVRDKSEILSPDEKLVNITPNGDCEFGAYSVLIYNKEDPHTIRRNVVKYMLKLSFGSQYMDKYIDYYKDFIEGINVPPLLKESRIISRDGMRRIEEFWKDTWFVVYDDMPEKIQESDELNIKVAFVIAHFMDGLPEINNLNENKTPTWGDISIIPSFICDLYEISLCIYVLDVKQSKMYIDYKGECDKYVHPNDNILRKLVLYNKKLGNHFDLIIPKDHRGLLDKAEIAANKLISK